MALRPRRPRRGQRAPAIVVAKPRNHLDPHLQQQDVKNGVTWLRAQPEGDADNMGGCGISLGGVHMLRLGAYDRRLKAVVSVATGLNTLERLMGREGMLAFLRILNGDHDRRFLTGDAATHIPAVSMPGKGGVMALPEAYDFYTEAQDTFAPTYDNRLTLESVENLIADHSADSVRLVAPPPCCSSTVSRISSPSTPSAPPWPGRRAEETGRPRLPPHRPVHP